MFTLIHHFPHDFIYGRSNILSRVDDIMAVFNRFNGTEHLLIDFPVGIGFIFSRSMAFL